MVSVFVSVLLVVVVVFGWRHATARKKSQAATVVTRAPRSGYHCVEVKDRKLRVRGSSKAWRDALSAE